MKPEQQKIMQDWQKELVKCIRCGTCRSVCPVFQLEDNENTTARGKVKLLESVTEGKLTLTPELQQRMSKCLLCKACVVGCPSGVKTDELFLSARKVLAQKNGLPLMKKIAFTGLTYRRLFDFGLRMGATFQGLVFKDSLDGRGKQPRITLPGAGLNDRRIIPPLATTPLSSQLPEVNRVKGDEPKARVAFFTGCMLNYVYPEAGKAIVEILNENNIEVIIPKKQYCCGTPAFTSGDFQVGQYLAEENVKMLTAQSYDAVITGCSSCGAALKHEYGQVIDDPAVHAIWQKLSGKVYDIMQYLVMIDYKKDFGNINTTVTYHDPCHLVRGMGVSQEPRKILKSIPGVNFVELKDANKCCGAAGTFSMAYYDIARKINDEKLDNVENTGCQVLVTGCSSCRMHIIDGLHQRDKNIEVMHTAQFIAQAYKAGKKAVNTNEYCHQ